jgi:hypothetical protein
MRGINRLVVAALVAASMSAAIASPALAQATQGIGVHGPEGWTVLRPSTDTKFIFVSSSEGNDANDGLSPERPKATIDQARRLVRAGYPDWVLLKRGDTWNEEFRWGGNGRSVEEPMVIGAYGDGTERPIVQPPTDKEGFAIGTGLLQFVALTGIEFRASGSTSHAGIRIVADTGQAMLIEDCLIDGFKDNVIVVSNRGLGGFEGFTFRRNVVVDSAALLGGHSQGMYLDAVDEIVIEDCVFDHNGWRANGSAPATMFNHNIYIQSNCGHATVRGNVIASGASHGVQARSGGDIENNLFVRNALAFFVSANPSNVRNNVVLEGRDIDAATTRGFGFEILGTTECLVQNNIIAHRATESPWGYAIQLSRGPTDPPEMSVRVEGNVVYDWPDMAFRAYRPDPLIYRNIELIGNDFQDAGRPSRVIEFAPPEIDLTRWEFRDNEYWSDKPAGQWFRVGTTSGDFPWWRSEAEEWSGVSRQVIYPDPNRSVATYWASLGEQGGYAGFMSKAREQSRADWDPRVTAAAVNGYIRDGFGVHQAP